MKVVTFIFACMAWIKCTISPDPPSNDRYFVLLKKSLALKWGIFEEYSRTNPPLQIEDGDLIYIHKVINGRFAPFDIVQGHVVGTARSVHQRTLESEPVNSRQRGEVEITIANPHFFYHAIMEFTGSHRNHQHDGELQYLLTIEKGPILFLAAVLRPVGQRPLVPENVPQVRFANHVYRTPGHNDVFTGQLFPADQSHVLAMLTRLAAYRRQ